MSKPSPPGAAPTGTRAQPAKAPETDGLGGLVLRWIAGDSLQALQVKAETAEQRLRAVFDRSSEGLVICDSAGLVQVCNTAAARLLGSGVRELVGTALRARVEPVGTSARPGDGEFPGGDADVLRADGRRVPVQIRVGPLPGGARPLTLVQLSDQSDRRQAQDRLLRMANYDSLTGLPNRALFRDRLARAMERASRTGRPMALMFLDLDRFKVVNDSLGHEAGDKLLQHVATTLSGCLRKADSLARGGIAADEDDDSDPFTLSRLGGDEFTVIAESVGGAEDAAIIAQRMLDALDAPLSLGDEEIVVSASIGISLFPSENVDLDRLVRHTDMAMYRAKSMGRGVYCFFSQDMNAAVSARLSLEGSLRRALEREEFELHYQPKASLVDGRVTSVEALIRWRCPERGLVPPNVFISVLEETGLILPVGAWVMRRSIHQLTEWDRMGLPPLRMAVNLSARQLRQPQLVALLRDTLLECGIDPGRFDVELTESMLMEDTDATREMLASFARIGVGLALDDFGTGHSSLSYLKRFNIDTLKVDRSFVMGLPGDAEDAALTQAVIAMGKALQMSIVAEGVETMEQAYALRDMGCDQVQGYLLSKPLAAIDFARWLRDRLDREKARRHERVFAGMHPRGNAADAIGKPMPTARAGATAALRRRLPIASVASEPADTDSGGPVSLSFMDWEQEQPSLESADDPSRAVVSHVAGPQSRAAGSGAAARRAGADSGWRGLW